MDTVPSASPPEDVPAAGAGERPYYSISQAAALLGVSRVTIWRWVRAGQLPVRRLGHRTTRIKREDLERVLAHSQRAGSRSGGVGDLDAGTAAENRAARNGAPHTDWAELSACEHVVQFYEADGFLLD